MYKFMNNNPYLKPDDDLGGGTDDFEEDNDLDFDFEDNNDDELDELSKEDEQPDKQEDKPKTYTGEDIRRAVEAERNKWKRKSTTQNSTPQNDGFNESDFYNNQVEYYIENDFDERLAKVLAKKDSEQKKKEIEIEKRLSTTGDYATTLRRDSEVQQMKSNPFYSDIDSVRPEVEKFANKSNITMEDAYFALYGKSKLPDWQRQVEATFLNEQAKKSSSRVNTTSGGNADKPKLELSQDELMSAKIFGMSPKEVKMLGKIDDVGKYQKYMKKKG